MSDQVSTKAIEAKREEVSENKTENKIILSESQSSILARIQDNIIDHTADAKSIIRRANQVKIPRKILDEAVLGVIRGKVLQSDRFSMGKKFAEELLGIGEAFNISNEKIKENILLASIDRIEKLTTEMKRQGDWKLQREVEDTINNLEYFQIADSDFSLALSLIAIKCFEDGNIEAAMLISKSEKIPDHFFHTEQARRAITGYIKNCPDNLANKDNLIKLKRDLKVTNNDFFGAIIEREVEQILLETDQKLNTNEENKLEKYNIPQEYYDSENFRIIARKVLAKIIITERPDLIVKIVHLLPIPKDILEEDEFQSLILALQVKDKSKKENELQRVKKDHIDDYISKLEVDLETNEYYYFFSLLADRFEPLNALWAKELEKRFNKKFKPIFILPFQHNKLFEEDNFIIINESLSEQREKIGSDKVINLIYLEDLNQQFSNSSFIKSLLEKLIKKQGKVFILSFTNTWLNIQMPNVFILGSDPEIVTKLDDKAEHARIFDKLGLKTSNMKIYTDFNELKKNQHEYPFFIAPSFTSGGIENQIISTSIELDNYYLRLREVNKKNAFISSSLINNIVLAPNVNAIVVGEDKTKIVCISDQILRSNMYIGNIYPSKIDEKNKKIIFETVLKLGNYLSKLGFRGLFGCDFLIDDNDNCFISDLNPRKQGGYFCNVMMSKKINIIELEVRLSLGESIPSFESEDFQVDYCWGHSKLLPYSNNVIIREEFENGKYWEPFEKIGSAYSALYYPKDHILIAGNPGFYMVSANSYGEVKERLLRDTEKIISESYSLSK